VPLPTLQVTVQPLLPEGPLEASRPLMLFVLGTAQAPPPFTTTCVALHVAVAVAVVLGTVTVAIAAKIPGGPVGPAGPVAPFCPCGPCSPAAPVRPRQSKASHLPSPLTSSEASHTPFPFVSQQDTAVQYLVGSLLATSDCHCCTVQINVRLSASEKWWRIPYERRQAGR